MTKTKKTDKVIIVINGKGGIGKDTLINNLISVSDIVPYNVSSIDPIKAKCREYGETGQKSKAYRKLLATLKKAYDEYELATNGVSFTEKYLLEKTELYVNNSRFGNMKYVMFVHIREPKNIQAYINDVTEKYPDVKVKTILITSKRAKESYGNEADEGVENYKYTHYFESNGSEEADSLRFAKFVSNIFTPDDFQCAEVLAEDENNVNLAVSTQHLQGLNNVNLAVSTQHLQDLNKHSKNRILDDNSQYYEEFAKDCRKEGICEDDIDLAVSTIKGMKRSKKV